MQMHLEDHFLGCNALWLQIDTNHRREGRDNLSKLLDEDVKLVGHPIALNC